ncbi:MAG: tetratricopeptide repeat protein [Acidobacteriota bacterium]
MNSSRLAASALLILMLTASAGQARTAQSDPAEIQALFQQGERALSEHRYADAEQAYLRMRQLQPAVAEVHARLGLIYFQQGRFAEALPPLQRALQLKPALPNVGALLAMSLSEIGRHDEALPGLEKAFHQSADPALRRMAGLHLQRSYTDLGRDRDAVVVALDLSRLYPDDPEVLYHTGRLFGNYAYLQTVKLARIAPDSVWLHQAAGEANESQGQLDEAISQYRQVLALAPNRPGIHFRLGRVLLTRSGQARADPAAESDAVKEFGMELQIDPTNADAAYEIGEAMRKAGHVDKAIESFRRAVDAYPAFEAALVGLERALVAAGDAGNALPPLQKAATLNPLDEVAFYHLAQAHRALGHEAEQQKALAQFERLRDEKARSGPVVPEAPSTVTKQQIDGAGGPK